MTLAALALGAAVPTAQAAPEPAELARADRVARSVPWRAPRARAERPPHPLGVQTLVIERVSRKGAPAGERRARVYQHDHDARLARRVLVDLVREEALEVRRVDSVHLPLNAAERAWAMARLSRSTSTLGRLREEQIRRGRAPFERLDELEVKAIVFEPTDPDDPCARERCALLALFDDTRTAFAVEPVVRFATGAVETLDARGPR